MTDVEIQEKLKKFNQDLDFLEKLLGVHVPLCEEVDEFNVPKLVPTTDVDQYVSFDTKVTYLNDYFENAFEEIKLNTVE